LQEILGKNNTNVGLLSELENIAKLISTNTNINPKQNYRN